MSNADIKTHKFLSASLVFPGMIKFASRIVRLKAFTHI